MNKADIYETIYSKAAEIPTLSVVITKLLALIEDENSNAVDVTNAISNDPALTSKILRVANSAYYGFSGEISEIEKAVPLLGFNIVQSLAITLGVVQALPQTKENAYISPEGLWRHSLAVATIFQKLGKTYGDGDDKEYRFIAGLLHDIGKLVLFQYFGDQFIDVLKTAAIEDNEDLHVIEQKEIGIDHCEISGMLLDRWKFPKKISDPIAYLHRKDLPSEVNQKDVSLLRIANVIAQELNVGKEGNPSPSIIRKKDLEFLNISEEGLELIRQESDQIKEDVAAFYDAMS